MTTRSHGIASGTPGRRVAAVAALLALLLAHAPARAADDEDRPSGFAMVGDLLFARPLGFVLTVAGTTAFVVSLPLTAASGSVREAGEALVVDPAMETFVRCLGCVRSGVRHDDPAVNTD